MTKAKIIHHIQDSLTLVGDTIQFDFPIELDFASFQRVGRAGAVSQSLIAEGSEENWKKFYPDAVFGRDVRKGKVTVELSLSELIGLGNRASGNKNRTAQSGPAKAKFAGSKSFKSNQEAK